MRILTAGESHGTEITAVIDGFPAGFRISMDGIRRALELRRGGYGRGPRMRLENDAISFSGGLAGGVTYGAPLCLSIRNSEKPSVGRDRKVPRPGHSEYSGCLKYSLNDASLPSECFGGRKSAIYVAIGEMARQFLQAAGIEIIGFADSIGGMGTASPSGSATELREKAEKSVLRMISETEEEKIRNLIDAASDRGDTIGGTVTVIADGVPPGLGSFSQFDRRLDAMMAAALMSVPGIKGVEVGAGFASSLMTGTEYVSGGPAPESSGGIDGGISNGGRITLHAAMKPIPTIRDGAESINLETGLKEKSPYVRSDACAVPACAIVCEAMAAITLMDAFTERFGSNTASETLRNFNTETQKLKRIIK